MYLITDSIFHWAPTHTSQFWGRHFGNQCSRFAVNSFWILINNLWNYGSVYVEGSHRWVSKMLVQTREDFQGEVMFFPNKSWEGWPLSACWKGRQRSWGTELGYRIEQEKESSSAEGLLKEEPCANSTQLSAACSPWCPQEIGTTGNIKPQVGHAGRSPQRSGWRATEVPQLKGHIMCQGGKPRARRLGRPTLATLLPPGLQGAAEEKPFRAYLADKADKPQPGASDRDCCGGDKKPISGAWHFCLASRRCPKLGSILPRIAGVPLQVEVFPGWTSKIRLLLTDFSLVLCSCLVKCAAFYKLQAFILN